jgi:hypothetical protein
MGDGKGVELCIACILRILGGGDGPRTDGVGFLDIFQQLGEVDCLQSEINSNRLLIVCTNRRIRKRAVGNPVDCVGNTAMLDNNHDDVR